MFCRNISRRKFIVEAVKAAGALAAGMLFPGGYSQAKEKMNSTVAVARGKSPREITRRAVELLGGMRRFVSRGDVVLVKPNIGWDRLPEQAANTHPEVVVALVEMALEAGAKKVKVFDRTCNEPRRCYINSGIQPALERFKKDHGLGSEVEIFHTERRKFVRVSIKGAEVLKKWPIYRDALEVDRVINAPVAKHHTLARYTLSLKNMMGVMGGNRGQIHWELSKALSDLNGFVRTDLAIVDATRVLLRNGPSGGNLADVEEKDMVIASGNLVAADSTALRALFGVEPDEVPHVKYAGLRGLGPTDRRFIRIVENP